jgi:hypothetical protein
VEEVKLLKPSAEKMETPRTCQACGEEIASTATLCKHCRTYQSAWRNWLLFAAQASGFIALLAATVAFLITNAPAIRKVLWWSDDVKILGLKSNQYLLTSNDGDGAVYVTHATFMMDLSPFGEKRTIQPFNVLVPQETILSLPIKPDEKGITKFVGSPSDEVWKIALERTHKNTPRNCFWPVVFAANDPTFLLVKQSHADRSETLRTFPASAKVSYYSPRTKRTRESTVAAIGALLFRDEPECTSP